MKLKVIFMCYCYLFNLYVIHLVALDQLFAILEIHLFKTIEII